MYLLSIEKIWDKCKIKSAKKLKRILNMKNGTMFSDLTKYKNKDFYKEHKYVQFDTTKASGTYLVVYAFVSEANVKNAF